MMFDEKGRLVVSLQATAADIDIIDAGGLITATEVESALQEIFGAYQAGGVARTLGGDLDMDGNSINNVLNLDGLSAAEIAEYANLGATTLSAAQLGYLGALTTHPLGSDGTAGRVPRMAKIRIENGAAANSLKCSIVSVWNGDAIALTDNIVKNATTGDFTLDAAGASLKIEASGLTGNALAVIGMLGLCLAGVTLTIRLDIVVNDIRILIDHATTGANQDITALVDTGLMDIYFLYVTDA